MLETLHGDLPGCNRRVGGLCSCVSYQLVHLEVRYVKVNLALFHHISACNSAIGSYSLPVIEILNFYPLAKYEKATPATIMMFDLVKLTTSTKMSPLHLATTRVVLSF